MIYGRYWTRQFSPPEKRKDNLELEQKMKNIKLHYYTMFVCGKQGSRSFSKHTYQQQSWQIQMINSLKPCFQRIYIINTFGGGRINNSGVRNRHLWIYSLPDCTEECPAFTVSKLRLNSQLYWSSITEGQRRLIHKSQQIMFKNLSICGKMWKQLRRIMIVLDDKAMVMIYYASEDAPRWVNRQLKLSIYNSGAGYKNCFVEWSSLIWE